VSADYFCPSCGAGHATQAVADACHAACLKIEQGVWRAEVREKKG
jgi:hypothetical protein